jgi:uncharacterized membrane protein YfcA
MLSRLGRAVFGLGRNLHEVSRAHAQWELQVSRVILARRKKLLLLALAPILVALLWDTAAGQGASSLPAASVTAGAAGDTLPQRVPVLGGSKAFMPSVINSTMFFGSIFVGLIAGLITGVIGAGGGYILTPALMSFGVRGIMSVGTDQFHLFAKAIMGTTIHHKLGNVNLRLAVWFVVGSFVGVTLGGSLSRAIFAYSPAMSDAVISSVYVVVLGSLGLFAVGDWVRLRRAKGESIEATTSLARWLQRLPLKPRVTFDEGIVPGGRSICVYPLVLCGFVVGFVASIMGVGGGFLTFPMFVYGMGVSTFTTVGTDILQIIFTTAYSSIVQYAVYGFVFYTVAIGMLVGSLVGVQLGALVTNVVKGSQIRAFYALTILAGFFNRLCALPRKLADLGYIAMSRETSAAIEQAGVYLFFGTVGFFALWIIVVFARKLRFMRFGPGGEPLPAGAPLIVNRRKFALGVAGLAAFAVALAVGTSPDSEGRSLLTRADTFFNQLAKNSAYSVPQARDQAAKLADVPVDIGIKPRDTAQPAHMMRLIADGGCQSFLGDDGRIRIKCSLGELARPALEDAELAFRNDTAAIEQRHGIKDIEAMYAWWTIFDSLARRYVQENRSEEADFAKFVSSRVLEPAYNFRGIEGKSIGQNVLPMAGLLGFYVVYTVWYGVSIMVLLEGMGITTRSVKGRKET